MSEELSGELAKLPREKLEFADADYALSTAMKMAHVPDIYGTGHDVGGLAAKTLAHLENLGWRLVRADE